MKVMARKQISSPWFGLGLGLGLGARVGLGLGLGLEADLLACHPAEHSAAAQLESARVAPGGKLELALYLAISRYISLYLPMSRYISPHLEVSSSCRSSADQLSPGPPTWRCREMQGGAGRCREVQGGAGRCREVQGGAGICRPAHLKAGLDTRRCREMQGDAHLESRLDEHGSIAEQRAHVGEHAPGQG